MSAENEKTHEKVAKRAEDVSMAAGVLAAAGGAGAMILAPTGLSAIGVALGITSAPLIVTVAPILGVAATVAGAVSGGAYFYSKWKNRQNSESTESSEDSSSDNRLSDKQIREIGMLEDAHTQGFISDDDFNRKIEEIIQV